MQSATVIDLSDYRERRRAAAAKESASAAPAAGFMGVMMVPAPFMMMWTPVWFAPIQAAKGHE